jgi:hypothetical protein
MQEADITSKILVEIFAHFHAVAVKRHSNMRNWVIGLSGRIVSELSLLCQIKWWVFSWLYSSLVPRFSVSVSMSTQPRGILYTASEDMLVLSTIVSSRYYNCYTDGSTNLNIMDTTLYGQWNSFNSAKKANLCKPKLRIWYRLKIQNENRFHDAFIS